MFPIHGIFCVIKWRGQVHRSEAVLVFLSIKSEMVILFLQKCSRQQTEPNHQLQGVCPAFDDMSGERALKSSRRKSIY